MDYRTLDCGNRPEPQALARDWLRTVVTTVAPLDDRLAAMRRALGKTHVNGGAVIRPFHIEAVDAVAWTLARNRLDKFDFFRSLFDHPAVVEAMPEARAPNDNVARFENVASELSFETLSTLIRQGGAYRDFTGSDRELAKLIRDFIDAVCGARFGETLAWVNWKPWSSWFFDIAWDASLFWFDCQRGVATILITTDTD